MIYLIRKNDRTIKTYLERGDDCVLAEGETLEILPQSFCEYAARLRLSAGNRSGEVVRVMQGSGTLQVLVEAPEAARVALRINDCKETVPLKGGRGVYPLDTGKPGRFEISPADRTQYCAAGEALLVVEVAEVKQVRAKFSYP